MAHLKQSLLSFRTVSLLSLNSIFSLNSSRTGRLSTATLAYYVKMAAMSNVRGGNIKLMELSCISHRTRLENGLLVYIIRDFVPEQ